ncbi:PAS domain-containing protein [Sphingomonas sp. NPDC019816]|uniref:PAS domain-containing protein n=1 Tax=Sphingomonas sp. NPDC019816 TaxID=3390679 RepID=UPI003D063499
MGRQAPRHHGHGANHEVADMDAFAKATDRSGEPGPGTDPSWAAPDPLCRLDDVVITEALAHRPTRAADHRLEADVTATLAEELASRPERLLQTLCECLVATGVAGSAGVSLLESADGSTRFQWVALAGAWSAFRGGVMPIDASPCGVVVARREMQLFENPARFFGGGDLEPPVHELLLVPIFHAGEPIGTLWTIAHDPRRKFDREDGRLLDRLSRFAAAGYQMSRALQAARISQSELEVRVEERSKALRESEERQVFLLQLSDALRGETNVAGVARCGLALLAERLALDRCYIAHGTPGTDRIDIVDQVGGDRTPPLPGRIRRSDFPQAARAALERALALEDVSTVAELGEAERRRLRELGIGALIAVVPHKGQKAPICSLGVISAEPRRWTRCDIALIEDVAERLWTAMEHVRIQATLRASEERLRRFGEASQDILWLRDADTLRWEYLTPAFEAIYGLARDHMLAGDHYRGWLAMIVPDDRPRAEHHIGRVRGGEHGVVEYRIRRPGDGAIRWLRDTGFPIADEQGQIRLIGGIGEDITDAKLVQDRIERSEERLRNAVEVGGLGLWDWDVTTDEIHWSDEHFRMEGYAVNEVRPSYENWIARVHPDDRAQTETLLDAARVGNGAFAHEFRVVHPDGSIHWLQSRGRFFYERGRATRMVGAIVETTDRRMWDERQQVLIAELQHRTRNLIGVVRSTAEKTARSSTTLAEFDEKFRDRLDALSRVQNLLSRLNDHDRVTFEDLIRTEVSALGGGPDRVTLDGPAGVRLRSSTVQMLAMALHELGTNAAKYGALAHPAGRLTICWSLEPASAEMRPWLHIDWRETGVPMPPEGAAPQGTGQGRELIERALPYQMNARTTYRLEADGVHCTIAIPLSLSEPEGNAA